MNVFTFIAYTESYIIAGLYFVYMKFLSGFRSYLLVKITWKHTIEMWSSGMNRCPAFWHKCIISLLLWQSGSNINPDFSWGNKISSFPWERGCHVTDTRWDVMEIVHVTDTRLWLRQNADDQTRDISGSAAALQSGSRAGHQSGTVGPEEDQSRFTT